MYKHDVFKCKHLHKFRRKTNNANIYLEKNCGKINVLSCKVASCLAAWNNNLQHKDKKCTLYSKEA